MNKKRRIINIFLCLMLLMILFISSLSLGKQVKAANITTYSYSSNTPFFTYYDEILVDNSGSIDCWFDTLEPTTNTSNFCSLSTATYENINGKTVYVDSLCRDYNESLNDPNFAEGILIYDCIKYKMAHPEEEVYLDFTTYRMSVTAAVCLKRDSKYFGYMRSLFDCEYDDFGFVRISFMLVEAARLGIHVNFIPHLNSYGVKQFSSTNANKYATKSSLSYETYFTNSLKKDCYSGFEQNKKVSNYFNYSKCYWLVSDNGDVDMMHTKICAVSAYQDYLGNEYSSGVFMTSANLDENDYLGRNGNNGNQSGAIISNHDDIYNVVHNYISMLSNYCGSEDSIIFRDIMGNINKYQIDMINSGRQDEIPYDERIVYMGSETDSIFEFYFTPLAGSVGVWDPVYNPYSKHFSKFAKSTGYVELIWVDPGYNAKTVFSRTIEDLIIETYHKNLNENNKLVLRLINFEKQYAFNDLNVGTDIGYKKLNVGTSVHAKDALLSYEYDNNRHYVSIITSCNFHLGALYYQSNFFFIVKETDDVGHIIYDSLKHAHSQNAI